MTQEVCWSVEFFDGDAMCWVTESGTLVDEDGAIQAVTKHDGMARRAVNVETGAIIKRLLGPAT